MKQVPLVFATIAFLVGCSTKPSKVEKNMRVETSNSSAPIQYVSHLITVPVKVNGSIESRFILDTGIGLNLISESFCKRLNCKKSGSYTGKRMSGQEITIPLSKVDSILLGAHKLENVEVGVFPDMVDKIDGFLSLGYFENTPFTIDYKQGLVILENENSLKLRRKSGQVVSLERKQDQSTLDVFLSMQIPDGSVAKVLVDTGSDSLILHERYMDRLHIKPDSPDVKKVEGKDETQHVYARYFTKIQGSVFPAQALQMKLENPKVMFQKIIYDGLVGHSYFKNFIATYNFPNDEMILSKQTEISQNAK